MIIQETVTITLGNKNSRYYKSLGYDIPRTPDKYGRLTISKGTQIKVKISDLSKGSCIPILCQCDECGKQQSNVIKYYTKNMVVTATRKT
ncbi:MAG: hypothetical protein ACOC80_10330 [Petrotogales bacterium]